MDEVAFAAKAAEEAVSLYRNDENRHIFDRLTNLAESVGKSLSPVLSNSHSPATEKSFYTPEFDHKRIGPVLREMKFERAIDGDDRPFDFYVYESTNPWMALNPITRARPTSVHAHECVCCSSVLCGMVEFISGLDFESGIGDPFDRMIVSTTSPILIDKNVLHQILTPEFAWYITCFEGPLSELTVFDEKTGKLRRPSWNGIYGSVTLMSDNSFVGGLLLDDSPESDNKTPVHELASSEKLSSNGSHRKLTKPSSGNPTLRTWENDPIRRPCEAARMARLLGLSDWNKMDDLALVQRIEAGLSFKSVEKIAFAIGPDNLDATIALLSGSDYSRSKTKPEIKLTNELSQKLYGITRVLDEALRMWD